MSKNRVIGLKNRLPWHLPADLRHFKAITLGHPIIMGRKTFLSIGRPLPSRRNIIISRNTAFTAAGCEVLHSIDAALAALKNDPEIFIIGGAEIFQLFMPFIQRIYLTVIHEDFEGDTFFPEINNSKWRETKREDHSADAENSYGYSFIVLDKI